MPCASRIMTLHRSSPLQIVEGLYDSLITSFPKLSRVPCACRSSVLRYKSYTKAFYLRLLFYHLSALMLAHRH